jgi:hypothetical protein
MIKGRLFKVVIMKEKCQTKLNNTI